MNVNVSELLTFSVSIVIVSLLSSRKPLVQKCLVCFLVAALPWISAGLLKDGGREGEGCLLSYWSECFLSLERLLQAGWAREPAEWVGALHCCVVGTLSLTVPPLQALGKESVTYGFGACCQEVFRKWPV